MAWPVSPGAGLSTPPDWALRLVPGLEAGEPPRRVERLGGGTVNEVFRVDSREGAYVVRLDGAAWRRPGVDRLRELALHQVAAAAGIAPAVVLAAPEREGLLVTRYHEGRCWQGSDYDDARGLQRLGERLFVLHRQAVPALSPFDPLAVAQGYVAALDDALAREVAPVMDRLARLSEDLKASAAVPAVVHGDLWEGNLLEGGRLWLLDWEYAQVTEPLMDIAGVLAYYPVAWRHARELLAAAGIPSPAPSRLSDRVEIYRILSWLWRLARGERADPL